MFWLWILSPSASCRLGHPHHDGGPRSRNALVDDLLSSVRRSVFWGHDVRLALRYASRVPVAFWDDFLSTCFLCRLVCSARAGIVVEAVNNTEGYDDESLSRSWSRDNGLLFILASDHKEIRLPTMSARCLVGFGSPWVSASCVPRCPFEHFVPAWASLRADNLDHLDTTEKGIGDGQRYRSYPSRRFLPGRGRVSMPFLRPDLMAAARP